jgi:hypothetical protein
MRWTATLAAFAAAVGLCAAQPPDGQPNQPNKSNAPFDYTQKQTPRDLVGTAPAEGGPKVCVYEPKATKKTVYHTVCKEYCEPDYSPLAVLRRCFGHNTCDGPCPPQPLVKTVLVKRSVPGPDKMVCALKDLPLVCPPGAVPPGVTAVPPPPGVLPVPGK